MVKDLGCEIGTGATGRLDVRVLETGEENALDEGWMEYAVY
jgi:hypothetical protein